MDNLFEIKDYSDIEKNEMIILYQLDKLINENDNLSVFISKVINSFPSICTNTGSFYIKFNLFEKEYTAPGTNYKNLVKVFYQDLEFNDEYFGFMEIFSIDPEVYQLDEDNKLLVKKVADKLNHYLMYKFLKAQNESGDKLDLHSMMKTEWEIILDIIRKTDQNLYSVLSRKMLNHLFTKGIHESQELYKKMGTDLSIENSNNLFVNRPSKKTVMMQSFKFGDEIYIIASRYFTDEEILNKIQKWINEEKTHYLIKLLANSNVSMNDISDAIRKYHNINPNFDNSLTPTGLGIIVALIRRFLTDSLEFIDIAKSFSDVEDFYTILQKTIFPPDSHGKLGGKGSGIFLARKIIEKSTEYSNTLASVKYPKTWYITSDGLYNFMYYNNMEDVVEQKYRDIDEIRKEYPFIIQAFKNAQFSPDIINGLNSALDDFGDNPIIVRSSSLLEDRIGAAFAGKYKSLFLANQGPKRQRLEELMDAISEVYASTFGPDPIGYRSERGYLDFNEEMGILLQEVVGQKVGKYFFPAYAGVAFSHNEFRWSPRIKREDGLIRLVVGLGTRAVDRVGLDFPILISPGSPNLRVNQTYLEVLNYAPKFIDVIDLVENSFITMPISKLIDEIGNDFPQINNIFSIVDGQHIKTPVGLGIDTTKDDIVVTFDKLVQKKTFIEQIKAMLFELSDKFEGPVDLEFACDGKNLYLLQCRPQSSSLDFQSAIIPPDISNSKIVFTANKYISNGKIGDITYIVYVDPNKYKYMENLKDLQDVGKAVGLLNKRLPKKSFILMGPGRWGSRDDIRQGVKVTYSDIHNTAILIEIAKKRDGYAPDLSFGTHFFQDLVEAGIKYIPLYPDEETNMLNEKFLLNAENTLERFLPEYAHIADVLRLVNIREVTGGQVLKVLLNADEDRALAYITDRVNNIHYSHDSNLTVSLANTYDEPLQWRKRMAESIALKLDGDRFNVKGVYLYGTVFNETAGPNSDIDILVHFDGDEEQRNELLLWFEGWNLCLSHINYSRTGYELNHFLDLAILSSEDIEEHKYYNDLINPANNTSIRLRMKNEKETN
ncbi:MAG TPA: PEP/pyruvate-binding domain-containing protein [Candidatus Kapabacteria bacterium]|nr:PEP/pyruvate-binding domain-containing protein [Candidatus Kapabacteria bacterium]